MTEIKLAVSCENCDEEIVKRILDFTGKGIVDVDLMIEGEGFDCNNCGKNTAVLIHKESF